MAYNTLVNNIDSFMLNRLIHVLFYLVIMCPIAAQTTGKISGRIVSAKDDTKLVGVNVVILSTKEGTSSDIDGFFNIINVLPGTYSLKIMMIGYESVVVKDVRVSVNRTVSLDIKMNESILEGQEVVVFATKFSTKKDQTGTIKNISSEEIEMMPVENLGGVVNMQAGVVAGHFRGGRSDEVSYLIDGVAVNDVFGGVVAVSTPEVETVQDLEVITGTFNAEYGNAMSGVVNAITKDGGDAFEFDVQSYVSGRATRNSKNGEEVYFHLDPFGLNTDFDTRLQLSGPIVKEKIHFFMNFRRQNNSGYLNGIRRFSVWDISNYYDQDSTAWYSENSGDSTVVAMNTSQHNSLFGKISLNPTKKIRTSIMLNYNHDTWQDYNHAYKYNPDGRPENHAQTLLAVFKLNHFLSNKMFYELKLSKTVNDFGSYVYKDISDHFVVTEAGIYQGQNWLSGDTVYSYVNDKYHSSFGPGFFTGGQDKNHTVRSTTTENIRLDMTWQATNVHSIKTGYSLSRYILNNKYHSIRNAYAGTAEEAFNYRPLFLGDSTVYADIYEVRPFEYGIYLQDKMEFKDMVINMGVRYDHFDANSTFPDQRRNPVNSSTYYLQNAAGDDSLDSNNNLILDEERMSSQIASQPAKQISPRFGFAYQLGDIAVLHFSYGHFLQMPPMYAIYSNHSSIIGPSDYSTTVGNTNLGSDSLGLNPQKTVSYEIGLWQQVSPNVGLEVNLYYRDIYNLLSVATVSTYNQIEYGIYTNKDYGNVRGLELKLDYTPNTFFVHTNYTYQYTRGNADNPMQTFNRQGASIDKVIRFIPMSWDQRHTFNTTVGLRTERYGFSLTGYYNSGTPYTFSPQGESNLALLNLYPNNDYKPSNYTVDCSGYYNLPIVGSTSLVLNFSIYNLLDRYNEYGVNSETGHAYTAIVNETELASHRSDFNSYNDRYKNPSMFSAPRMIKFGLSVKF